MYSNSGSVALGTTGTVHFKMSINSEVWCKTRVCVFVFLLVITCFQYSRHSLSLSFCLGCLPLLTCLPVPFLRSLLRMMFLRYHTRIICDLSSVCLFCFDSSVVAGFSLLSPFWQSCPSQATFTSAFFFLSFFFFVRPCSFLVSYGSIWLGSIYLVTTTGFVADQLM